MTHPSLRNDPFPPGWFVCDRPARWGILLFVAVVTRGLALWQFGGQLAADPDAYRNIARNVAAGNGFGFTPGQPNGSPTAYRPPLYPWLLSVVERVAGGDELTVRRLIGLAQLLAGTATVVLVVGIARQLHLERVNLLVGLIVALDPVSVYNTTLVMTETIATLLTALFYASYLRARGQAGWLVAGVVFGLCCLCRPTFWAFGILVLAGAWFWRRSTAQWTDGPWRFTHLLAALVGVALTVAPWVVRNAMSMGRPILTTTHGGYTLLLGHNPIYTREVVDRAWGSVWHIDADEEWIDWLNEGMRRESPPLDYGEPPSPALEIARDRWMSHRAWQYMRESPGTALRSSLTLLGRFWNLVPMLTTNRSLPAPLRWMIGLFYAALFAAMVAGLLRLRREEWPRWWPSLALLLSFTAVHALYWSDMRMRAPLMPAMALLAARGIAGRKNAA